MPGYAETEQDRSLSGGSTSSPTARSASSNTPTGSASRTSSTSSRSTTGSGTGYGSSHSAERERDTSLGSRSSTSTGYGSSHSAERERDTSLGSRSSSTGFGDSAHSQERGRDTSLSRPSSTGFGNSAMSGASRSTAGKTATGFDPLTRQSHAEERERDPTIRASPTYRSAEEDSMRSFYTDWLDRTGVTDRIIGVESAGDPLADNPLSSAGGAGQFIDSTWLDMVKRHRPDVAAGRTDKEIIALKSDFALSREMVTRYAEENIERLRREGIDVTPGSVYMAHFAGPDGAVAVYKANPAASASTVFSPTAIRSNGSILTGTVGDVRAWADRKMGAPQPGLTANLGGEISTIPSPRPNGTPDQAPRPTARSSFIDRYISPDREVDRSLRPATAPLTPPSSPGPRSGQTNMPTSYPTAMASPQRAPQDVANIAGPRGLGGPGGISLDGLPQQQDERYAAGRVASAPSPSPAPAAPSAAPAASAPAVAAEQTKRTGGIAGQIVAGGIDLLVGGAPGVGLANTLAGLFTEGGSLGTRVVDDFLNGDSQSESDTASFKHGESDNRTERQASPRKKPSTPQEAAADFEQRYLVNLWRPNLPTPEQKWGPGLLS